MRVATQPTAFYLTGGVSTLSVNWHGPSWCFASTEIIRLTSDGEKGGGGGGYGDGERWLRLYTYRYTVTTDQNDCCIKMGSNESHSNVSFSNCEGLSQDSVHRPQLLKTEKGEAKLNRTEVLLLTTLTPYRLAKQANPTLLAKPVYVKTDGLC